MPDTTHQNVSTVLDVNKVTWMEGEEKESEVCIYTHTWVHACMYDSQTLGTCTCVYNVSDATVIV